MWEHERYSAYRGATISGHSNPYHPMRSSILDDGHNVDSDKVSRKVEVVQKALLEYVFNVSEVMSADQTVNPYLDYKVSHQFWQIMLSFVS